MSPRVPCATCPWRVGVVGARDIPGFESARLHRLVATCQDDGLGVMACHHSLPGEEYPCAGYVLQVGYRSIGWRLRSVWAKRDLSLDYASGEAELHPDFAAMVAAAVTPRSEP